MSRSEELNISTYEEFQSFCRETVGWLSSSDTLEIDWCVGGLTGGSCWGSVADTPVMGDPEPEFTSLDDILVEVAPQMGILQYKKILQLVKTSTRGGGGDYYGNYTRYAVKTMNLKELYRELVRIGLL